jgi:putative phosphoesterase
MKIGLLSDTHSHLDAQIFEYFADCDEIWHAGDIGSHELADKLEAFKPLRAVYGNIDDKKMQLRFPEHNRFKLEGLDIWITHIGGYPGKYPKKIKETLLANPPDIYITGHSHILKVMRDPLYGLLHMNPGACGIEGWHKMKTILRFELIGGQLTNLELIELGPRAKITG